MRALILLMSLQAVSAFASPVSFKNEVKPVLTKYCVMCHIPGAAQADLVLYPDAWIKMVNAPSTQSPLALIEPGSPEKSYFYLKLINEHMDSGSGVQMPYLQAPLDPVQIETIRLWIEQDAPQD